MKYSLVSVIIPVFNRAEMIEECVNSVLQQSYQEIELIIVDDGSTDNSSIIIKTIAKKNPQVIRYIYQKNSGVGTARNTGLVHAKGEFIQYLDSDDLLKPTKLEQQVNALRKFPEADVAYCTTIRTNLTTGTTWVWARTADKIEKIFPDFLIHRGWHTISPLWRRSIYSRIDGWGDFRCMEDWEHDLRAGMLDLKIVHVPEPLALVRDHEGERASGMQTGFTPAFTRDFFRAHKSIWLRMQAQGLTDWSYLEQFSRKMFWIARMCGERELIEEGNEALAFAIEMVAIHKTPWEMRIFKALTKTLGWPRSVTWMENIKKNR